MMKEQTKTPPSAAHKSPARPTPGFPPPPCGTTNKPRVAFGSIPAAAGHRVCLYGSGGIGKTTLAAQMPAPVAFIDLDESLPVLASRLAEGGILDGVRPVEGVKDWGTLLGVLNADGWEDVRTVVIDTATRAEQLCESYVIANCTNDKGAHVANIEGFGFGKGYVIKADMFNQLLAALDRHARAGRNVVLICHDCTSNVPNPEGEDWIRYEPRLQNPPSGKASIRAAVKEWCDHLLFVGYDVAAKDGKAKGCGTRTMYTAERPHCMAKSRTTGETFPITDAFNWGLILK